MKFRVLSGQPGFFEELLARKINVDGVVSAYLASKTQTVPVYLTEVPTHVCLILKQEMLSLGADAAIPASAIMERKENDCALLLGNPTQYSKLAAKLADQPFGLKKLGIEIEKAVKNCLAPSEGTKIMGILNITPDSFYDGGKSFDKTTVAARVAELEMHSDIIDVGAESSRPGSDPVPAKEEIARLELFFGNIRTEKKISLDTSKFEVFENFLDKVDIINDISGLADHRFIELLSTTAHDMVLMHMKGTPKTMQDNPVYEDVVSEIMDFFESRLEALAKKNIPESRVILDPGIGFGKRFEDNIAILKQIDSFRGFGARVLVGHSNKSFLKNVLGKDYNGMRIDATLGLSAYLALKKVDILRVHEADRTVAALRALNELG